MRLIKFLTFYCVLKPIILNDYRLRTKGKRPDRFHWADKIALQWGYFVP